MLCCFLCSNQCALLITVWWPACFAISCVVTSMFCCRQDTAAQAVLKTDGLQIGDHMISVAISNPPQRKQPLSQQTPSLGGGKKETEMYVAVDTSPAEGLLNCVHHYHLWLAVCASLGTLTCCVCIVKSYGLLCTLSGAMIDSVRCLELWLALCLVWSYDWLCALFGAMIGSVICLELWLALCVVWSYDWLCALFGAMIGSVCCLELWLALCLVWSYD